MKPMWKLPRLAIPLLLAGATLQPAAAAPCETGTFQVIAVPLSPASLNESLMVVGTSERHRAALWSARSGVRELPLPEGFDVSEAVSINDSGRVLAVAFDRTFTRHQAFTFSRDAITLLPGDRTRAFKIARSGEIAGESQVPGKPTTEPVTWIHERLRSIGGCCGGSAVDVNEHGQTVGDIYDAQGRYHAFRSSGSGGPQIIGPPDAYSSAIAINEPGHVLLQAAGKTLWFVAGTLTPVTLAAKFRSHPRAINDHDMIVGSFGPHSDADRAFLWDRSLGFRDLNQLIPANSGWKLESAVAINDAGAIAGKGDRDGEEGSGFLLVPEPRSARPCARGR
jgi:hypothetical protein